MKLDFLEVKSNLAKLNHIINDRATKIMEYTMADATSYAKRSAPWKDRTGNARRSIDNKVSATKDVVRGVIGIGVFYGKYLELSRQGKYRIIRPTVDIYRYKLLTNLKDLL